MRLPPWRSPWKIPWIMHPSVNPRMPTRTTSSVLMPAACMPSTSSNEKPSKRSMTRMRRVTSVGCGRGTTYPRWLSDANTVAMSIMFSASSRKSSSSQMVSANSSTSAGGLASAAIGIRPTSSGAIAAMTCRSRWTWLRMVGRCTFTTTGVPSCSVAPWTWAIDAAAIGVRSKVAKIDSMLAPSSDSTTSRTDSNDSAGTLSRHFFISSTSSAGKMPSPELTIWQSLMYVGPRRSAASRRRRDTPAREVAPPRRRSPAAQMPTAPPSRPPTTTSRPRGGSRRARVSSGTCRRVASRSTRMPRIHASWSRSTFHGPFSVNDPQVRSSGVGSMSAMGPVSHWTSLLPRAPPRPSPGGR